MKSKKLFLGILLVLAFAGPVIPSRQSEVHSGSTVVSVYVDNTYSMEAATRDGSQLADACDRAREIAAAYSPSDRFQLLTADLAMGPYTAGTSV